MKQNKKSIEYNNIADFLDNHLGVHRIAQEIISSGENISVFKDRIYEEISDYLKSDDGIKKYGEIVCKSIDIQKVCDLIVSESVEDWYNKEYDKYYELSDESSDNKNSNKEECSDDENSE
jgi:hypothetical protein